MIHGSASQITPGAGKINSKNLARRPVFAIKSKSFGQTSMKYMHVMVEYVQKLLPLKL